MTIKARLLLALVLSSGCSKAKHEVTAEETPAESETAECDDAAIEAHYLGYKNAILAYTSLETLDSNLNCENLRKLLLDGSFSSDRILQKSMEFEQFRDSQPATCLERHQRTHGEEIATLLGNLPKSSAKIMARFKERVKECEGYSGSAEAPEKTAPQNR
jgi:hypothetical protein